MKVLGKSQVLFYFFFCYSVDVPHGVVALLGGKTTLELNFGLKLVYESLYFSSDFVLVFSIDFKDVICHMRINE